MISRFQKLNNNILKKDKEDLQFKFKPQKNQIIYSTNSEYLQQCYLRLRSQEEAYSIYNYFDE
jgi:hypothetical protein